MGDFSVVGETIFDVQADGVLDVFDSLFVGVALGVTALKGWTGDEVAVSIGFDNNRQSRVPHAYNEYRAVSAVQSMVGHTEQLGVGERRRRVALSDFGGSRNKWRFAWG